jgi:3-hydroxybutyryl-CoA dehydrogenase
MIGPAMGVEIKTVGVIGAGQMGNGIAHVCALAGLDVRLHDVSEEKINAGLATITGNMARQVSKGAIPDDDRQAALARIKPAPTYDGLNDCDIVIEAASENEEVKRKIFSQLCPALRPHAMIATNTSSISITRLAASTGPAGALHRHPLHEPGAGDAARRADPRHRHRRDHVPVAKQFVDGLGKTTTVAEDFPAFIVNRILLPMINEAIYTLYEGVGSVEAIDTRMRLGANHPMGPLQLADFIGLDTCLSVMQVLHEGLADSSTAPARCS